MVDGIWQCCYTNATKEISGTHSSGWQPVAVSEDVPRLALANCVAMQNLNSNMQMAMTGEDGKPLNLFEIVGDGSYLYEIRTRYGMTDRLGRPNMFSHAYLFAWEGGCSYRNPNSFLTIEDQNFASGEEEAIRSQKSLIRSRPFTIEQALEAAGMSMGSYRLLVRCVYVQMMEKKAPKPLYIQYDGTPTEIRAILFCIYFGIPYYMRKKLSAASAPTGNDDRKNLIFTNAARDFYQYIIPRSGENNLLSTRMEKRIERYGYIDYFVSHLSKGQEMNYFDALEKMAMKLGDGAASDDLILKIAHQYLMLQVGHDKHFPQAVSAFSKEELINWISDVLRSRSFGNESMESDILTPLLRELCSRQGILTPEMEMQLEERSARASTQDMKEAVEAYRIMRLCQLPSAEGAAGLRLLDQDDFSRYARTMEKMEKGQKILARYQEEEATALRQKEAEEAALAEKEMKKSFGFFQRRSRKRLGE